MDKLITNEKRFLTTEEVADLLRMTRAGVTQWIRKGKLTATRIGRNWLVSTADLEAMLEARQRDGE